MLHFVNQMLQLLSDEETCWPIGVSCVASRYVVSPEAAELLLHNMQRNCRGPTRFRCAGSLAARASLGAARSQVDLIDSEGGTFNGT